MGKSGFCQLEKSVYLCKPKTIDVMKLKAIILIFSLLFLPVVAAGQGRIQIPKKKTETVKPKPKKEKDKAQDINYIKASTCCQTDLQHLDG